MRGPPLLVLGHVAATKGEQDRAQLLYSESIEVLRRAGDHWGLGIVLAAAANLAIVRRDYTQASAQASEALSLCQELADPRGIAWSLEVSPVSWPPQDSPTELPDCGERQRGCFESVGGSLAPSIRWLRERYIESARALRRRNSFETARNEGHAMSLPQIAFRAPGRCSQNSIRISSPLTCLKMHNV